MKTVLLAIFARAVSIAEAQAVSVPVRELDRDECLKARYYDWPCN